MQGAREGIPKEETYNKYGDAARKIEIGEIGKQWGFYTAPFSGIPEGGR